MLLFFFVALGRTLQEDPALFDASFDETQSEIMINNETEEMPNISDILSQIKNIESIIVVDDVRKYGPEDIKRLHEELVWEKNEHDQ